MSVWLCAEIGQGHQGSPEVAKDLVRICAHPQRGSLFGEDVGGVDAIKLTKRHMAHELTDEAAARPYAGEHAFGPTYGEHRKRLELTDEEHGEVAAYARSLGLEFVETVCAIEAMGVLKHTDPDRLKVASRDLTNYRLLKALAATRKPLILSTGMADRADLDRALEVVVRWHENITILHCLSEYPAKAENLNLLTIPWLRQHYPYPIGYSDHTVGVWASSVAIALGAEVVEKHVTLDRMMRGTDHAGALERDGIYRWVRDAREVERALGSEGIGRSPASDAARLKLARSVATRIGVPAGERISAVDLEPLSPGTGIPWSEHERFVGMVAIRDIPPKHLLTATMAREPE